MTGTSDDLHSLVPGRITGSSLFDTPTQHCSAPTYPPDTQQRRHARSSRLCATSTCPLHAHPTPNRHFLSEPPPPPQSRLHTTAHAPVTSASDITCPFTPLPPTSRVPSTQPDVACQASPPPDFPALHAVISPLSDSSASARLVSFPTLLADPNRSRLVIAPPP